MSIEVLIPSDYPLLILTILMKFNDVSTVMPFSHHSHSGQFCEGHARNTLEEIVQTAIRQNLHTFAFTEHMPREERDFYPEEVRHVAIASRMNESSSLLDRLTPVKPHNRCSAFSMPTISKLGGCRELMNNRYISL